MRPSRLAFSLPLEPSRLLRARHRIRDYLYEHVARLEAVDDIVLAIEEAMTNAVRHSGATEDLDVAVWFDEADLVALVRDCGHAFDIEAFDRSAVPDLDKPGGRGLFLISRLMDHMELRRDGGLELRVVKRDVLDEARSSAERMRGMTPGAQAHRDLRQRKMLDELPELYAALDWEFRYLYVNQLFCRITGKTENELVGRTLWELFPEVLGTDVEGWLLNAMNLGQPQSYEFFFPPLDSWFEQRLYPTAFGISQFSVAINERKRRELEREELVVALQRANEATAGRERRVTQLKNEVDQLLGLAGLPPRYSPASD
jgi:anti-sigma regulatory factor (Ser/Thr protein kinase)